MNPDVYAKAMFALSTAGKTADEVVSGAMRSLKARGAMGLLPKVLSSYERLMARIGTQGSVLTIAREADSAEAMKMSNAKSDTKVVVDERIVGGYRLEDEGKLVDESFKAQLLQVYRNATKA